MMKTTGETCKTKKNATMNVTTSKKNTTYSRTAAEGQGCGGIIAVDLSNDDDDKDNDPTTKLQSTSNQNNDDYRRRHHHHHHPDVIILDNDDSDGNNNCGDVQKSNGKNCADEDEIIDVERESFERFIARRRRTKHRAEEQDQSRRQRRRQRRRQQPLSDLVHAHPRQSDHVEIVGDHDGTSTTDDEVVAWSNRKRDPNEDAKRQEQETTDLQLALDVQKQLHHDSIRLEDEAMTSSSRGKAWKFVEKVLGIHKRLMSMSTTTDASTTTTSVPPNPIFVAAPQQQNHIVSTIEPVAVDDMVFLTERLIGTLDEFRTKFNLEGQQQQFCHVDIGYHYTQSQNLKTIKTDGLLTKAERDQNKILASYNGSSMGDGIYTASSPKTTLSYGDVGLLVARLRGREKIYTPASPQQLQEGDGYDSVVWSQKTVSEIVVLKRSSQCLALIQFPSTIYAQVISITPSGGLPQSMGMAAFDAGTTTMTSSPKTKVEMMYLYHCELQKLIDETFNEGSQTQVLRF